VKKEGYIKFDFERKLQLPNYPQEVAALNQWRSLLYENGLIGAYPNGAGFGNISVRLGQTSEFLISATSTGQLPVLGREHYVQVVTFDLQKNFVKCRGVSQPSSESLSHAAFYDCCPQIGAVVHVHHLALWARLYEVAATTSDEVEYGTPALAYEIQNFFKQQGLRPPGLMVIGGHKEGLFSFACDLEGAAHLILQALAQF